MADHFLDTETRHDIPLTALRCTEAELTTCEARRVWCHEVSPVVGFNRWPFAGQWAGWDRDWLIEEVDKVRRGSNGVPASARTKYPDCDDGVMIAIERCMEVLLRFELPGERERVARDLAGLARHFFDFVPDDYTALCQEMLARLKALYPEPFRHALSPALVRGELAGADQRVRAALQLPPPPTPWMRWLRFWQR